MDGIYLKCVTCQTSLEMGNYYRCPKCGNSLEVIHDYSFISPERVRIALSSYSTLWDFRVLLPVRDQENIITLQEGATPLLQSQKLQKKHGIKLYFKDETRNPTGAFKDRPNTVGISVAKSFGLDTVTIASTGNGAASLSAYAAKAGMKCYVFVPANTPEPKIAQAAAYGATIVKVVGDYSNAYQLSLSATKAFGWANLTSTYLNPYTVEGDKTIAYEIFRQLAYIVPDWIVVPLGAGAMLTGILKGFEELQIFGMAQKIPKMIGVQARGCSPITKAFESGADVVEAFFQPSTVAGAICDPLIGYSSDGTRTLASIRRSGGVGISVSDQDILDSMRSLAEQEAVFCEPASAATQAAVETLSQRGIIRKNDLVVSIITGHGLKDIEAVDISTSLGETVEPNLEVLRQKYQI